MNALMLADAFRSHRLHDGLLELKISPTRAAFDATLALWYRGWITDGWCIATMRAIAAQAGDMTCP